MERDPDVEGAFVRVLAALSAGDVTGISRLATTSAAATLVGSAPGEWLTGPKTWSVLPTLARAFHAAGLTVTADHPPGYADGSTGWVVDRPRWRTRTGTETQTRMTAIFYDEQGTWKLVHIHHTCQELAHSRPANAVPDQLLARDPRRLCPGTGGRDAGG